MNEDLCARRRYKQQGQTITSYIMSFLIAWLSHYSRNLIHDENDALIHPYLQDEPSLVSMLKNQYHSQVDLKMCLQALPPMWRLIP